MSFWNACSARSPGRRCSPQRLDYLNEGLALERQGDFEAALTSYRLAFRDNPDRLAHPAQHGHRVHQDRPAGRGHPALQARAGARRQPGRRALRRRLPAAQAGRRRSRRPSTCAPSWPGRPRGPTPSAGSATRRRALRDIAEQPGPGDAVRRWARPAAARPSLRLQRSDRGRGRGGGHRGAVPGPDTSRSARSHPALRPAARQERRQRRHAASPGSPPTPPPTVDASTGVLTGRQRRAPARVQATVGVARLGAHHLHRRRPGRHAVISRRFGPHRAAVSAATLAPLTTRLESFNPPGRAAGRAGDLRHHLARPDSPRRRRSLLPGGVAADTLRPARTGRSPP